MSFLSGLSTGVSAFLKYGPAALQAITQVETLVGSGNGATKKQLALGAVLAVVHAGETVNVPIVQVVSTVIDVLVSQLNLTGELPKSATAPAATAPAATAPVPVLVTAPAANAFNN